MIRANRSRYFPPSSSGEVARRAVASLRRSRSFAFRALKNALTAPSGDLVSPASPCRPDRPAAVPASPPFRRGRRTGRPALHRLGLSGHHSRHGVRGPAGAAGAAGGRALRAHADHHLHLRGAALLSAGRAPMAPASSAAHHHSTGAGSASAARRLAPASASAAGSMTAGRDGQHLGGRRVGFRLSQRRRVSVGAALSGGARRRSGGRGQARRRARPGCTTTAGAGATAAGGSAGSVGAAAVDHLACVARVWNVASAASGEAHETDSRQPRLYNHAFHGVSSRRVPFPCVPGFRQVGRPSRTAGRRPLRPAID